MVAACMSRRRTASRCACTARPAPARGCRRTSARTYRSTGPRRAKAADQAERGPSSRPRGSGRPDCCTGRVRTPGPGWLALTVQRHEVAGAGERRAQCRVNAVHGDQGGARLADDVHLVGEIERPVLAQLQISGARGRVDGDVRELLRAGVTGRHGDHIRLIADRDRLRIVVVPVGERVRELVQVRWETACRSGRRSGAGAVSGHPRRTPGRRPSPRRASPAPGGSRRSSSSSGRRKTSSAGGTRPVRPLIRRRLRWRRRRRSRSWRWSGSRRSRVCPRERRSGWSTGTFVKTACCASIALGGGA